MDFIGGIVSTLLGAFIAIMARAVPDAFNRFETRRHSDQRKTKDIYTKFSAPLAESCEGFIRRLSEIIDSTPSVQYFEEIHSFPYAFYKRKSTSYRLARVLGYIKLMEDELRFLPQPNKVTHLAVRDAIVKFQRALADGDRVETLRLYEILTGGRSDNESTDDQRVIIRRAVQDLEFFQKSFVHSEGAEYPNGLSPKKKREFARGVYELLETYFDKSRLRYFLDERELCDRLSHREVWIYRDLQAGIGSAMINKAVDGRRDIIGYHQFLELVDEKNSDKYSIFKPTLDLFKSMNCSPNDSRDHRFSQIKDLRANACRLFTALCDLDVGLADAFSQDFRIQCQALSPTPRNWYRTIAH